MNLQIQSGKVTDAISLSWYRVTVPNAFYGVEYVVYSKYPLLLGQDIQFYFNNQTQEYEVW